VVFKKGDRERIRGPTKVWDGGGSFRETERGGCRKRHGNVKIEENRGGEREKFTHGPCERGEGITLEIGGEQGKRSGSGQKRDPRGKDLGGR